MKLMITGANGFVGSSIVVHAQQVGHQVIGADIEPPARPAAATAAGQLQRLAFDLRRPRQVLEAVDAGRPDAIVHCAAYGVDHRQQDVQQAVAVNVTGALTLWQAAQRSGVVRLIHLGTAYEYGDSETAINEAHPLRPRGIYGATKAAGAMILEQAGRAGPPRPIVLRPFGLYGPGEGKHKLVPQVIDACRRREPLDLGDGREERDYLFVGDLARRVVALASLPDEQYPAGQVFNLCSGEALTIRALVETIARQLGGLELMRFGARSNRPDSPPRVVGDPSRWRELCRRIGRSDLLELTPLEQVVAAFGPGEIQEQQ